MRKLIKKVALSVLATAVFVPVSAYSEATPAQYEKALMKYVLSYEALQKAKEDPSKASELPKFLKKYRQSYSEYINLMQENDLYNPADKDKKNDPAGNFNRKRKKQNKPKQKWKKVNTAAPRQNVRQKIDMGLEPDEAVNTAAAEAVPKQGLSRPECASDTSPIEACGPQTVTLQPGTYNTGDDFTGEDDPSLSEYKDKSTGAYGGDLPGEEDNYAGRYNMSYYPDAQGRYPNPQGRYCDSDGRYPDQFGRYPSEDGYPNIFGNYPDSTGNYPHPSSNGPMVNGYYPNAQGKYPDANGNYPDVNGYYPIDGFYPDDHGKYPVNGVYPDNDGNYPEDDDDDSDDTDD